MNRRSRLRTKTPLTRRTPLLPSTHQLIPLQGTCCGKKRFATREAADAALLRIARTTPEEKYPQYAYECENGWWHLTKKAPWRKTPLRTSKEKRTGRRDTGPDRSVKAIVDERDNWTCAACGNSVYGRPFSRQHRVAKGMGGTSLAWKNRPSNIILLCGSATSPGGCHLACEQRNERMHDLGFWLEQTQRPWLEPVAHALYGWVYLLDEQRPDGSWVMPADETGGAA